MCPRPAVATINGMQTTVYEIADRVYRLSTCVPEVAPGGFTFNQYLLDGDEPLLFHTGPRRMFPLVAAAVAKVMPVERLRWVSFGHVEADECGAMNEWLAAAPAAEVLFNTLGCQVSLDDLADRPPVHVPDDSVRDIGGHRIRTIATPHVPHGWEAGAFYEETAGTLFCGDLLTHVGDPAPLTGTDILGAAIAAENAFGAMTMAPGTGAALRRLADLAPRTLALMHGSSFEGDGAATLNGLAEFCEARRAGGAA